MARKAATGAEAELRAFRRALKTRPGIRGFFRTGPVTVTRAPARLDVMGGIADYSGASVCQLPLAHGAVVGIQRGRGRTIRIHSAGIEEHGYANDFEVPLGALYRGSRLQSYAEIRTLFERDARRSWAAYVAGAIFVLLKEGKLRVPEHGFDLVVLSHVPMNVGIASSATIEVATLYAVDQLMGLGLDGVELGRLGQIAENRVVGAPCGIMDQLAAACGQRGKLMHILCQPGTVCGMVDAPSTCGFVGINSKVKHSVGGEKYSNTRVATFMGRKIIFDHVRKTGDLGPGEEPFGGYLCNIDALDYSRVYEKWLPARTTGAAFLRKHKTTEDPVAPVDPGGVYRVRSRTSHPVHEHARVKLFMSRLYNARITGDRRFLVQAGELMYASHWSYAKQCGQSCAETDAIVEIVREMGVRAGLYGAKITGGGSGGTVAVLGERDKLDAAVDRVVDAYEKRTGHRADVFTGSSEGAYELGSAQLKA